MYNTMKRGNFSGFPPKAKHYSLIKKTDLHLYWEHFFPLFAKWKMTNEWAVPFPTSFLLLLVQASPLLRLPPAHHSCTRGYLLGTTCNLGGGGGGGGGGNGGGGLHWQICWQLSVTFSATGLEHDFWGSPRAICEETGHCMSSRNSENWFSMNVFLGLEYPSSTSNLYSELSWNSSLKPLQGGLFPTQSPFLIFLLFLQDLFPSVKFG